MKVKLAVIRDNEIIKCPFGLSVPDACLSAGNIVTKMTIIKAEDPDIGLTEVEAETIVEANNRVLMYSPDAPCKCKFANSIFNKEQKVECNYSEADWNMGTGNFMPQVSPYQQWGVNFYSLPAGDFGGYRNENLAGEIGMSNNYYDSNRVMASTEEKEK